MEIKAWYTFLTVQHNAYLSSNQPQESVGENKEERIGSYVYLHPQSYKLALPWWKVLSIYCALAPLGWGWSVFFFSGPVVFLTTFCRSPFLRLCLLLALHLLCPLLHGGGAQVTMFAFWPCLQLSFDGSGGLEVEGGELDWHGIYILNAADCDFASLKFSTTVSTEVPKRPEGEIRTSRWKVFSLSLISERFNHRCLFITTIATIVWPIAAAIYSVAWRARSVAQFSDHLRGQFLPLIQISQQASLICLQNQPDRAYALPIIRGLQRLRRQVQSLQRQCLTLLASIIRMWEWKDVSWIWLLPGSLHLGVKIQKK